MSTEVQEHRSTGVQDYRNTGVQDYMTNRNTGGHEYTTTGVAVSAWQPACSTGAIASVHL